MTDTSAIHPTIAVPDPRDPYDDTIEIDELLASLMIEMWVAGIRTVRSCQDPEEYASITYSDHPRLGLAEPQGRAEVVVSGAQSLFALLNTLANNGPRDDLYVRMVHPSAPQAWATEVQAVDAALDEAEHPDELGPSDFVLIPHIKVRFPQSDIPEMVARLQRHNDGEAVEPGPVDWSLVMGPAGPETEEDAFAAQGDTDVGNTSEHQAT